jgi:hypothetical protein
MVKDKDLVSFGYIDFPTPFVKEIVFSPMYVFGSFVKIR